MSFFQFHSKIEIDAGIENVWNFISSPVNLKEITPDYMGFDITSKNLEAQMYEGMIISYQVSPLLGIKTTWVTEITHVKEKRYFVDEQRVGPYKMWHHQHFIEPTDNGTLMSDIVSYQPPFGVFGKLANGLFIEKKLNEIFDYRTKALFKRFGEIVDAKEGK
jgi:ligand-binding SRPBCC domain-containing protein